MTTTPTSAQVEDVADLADVLANLGRYWANVRDVAFAGTAERMYGYAHSFLVTLEGFGGADQHRLAPKTHPDHDLVLSIPHDKLGAAQIADPLVAELITAIRGSITRCAGAFAGDPDRDALGAFITHLCRLVADGYTLQRVRFDDTTEAVVGADIAWLMPDAFATAWQTAR